MAKDNQIQLDLTGLSDRSIQKLLREIDCTELAHALRAATKQTQAKVFRNMSKGAGTQVRDEMGQRVPDARKSAELAVKRVNGVIGKLIEAGEIRRGDPAPSGKQKKTTAIAIDVSDAESVRESFLSIAGKARADGLLGLEHDVDGVEDDFLRKGFRLVIDGTDPDLVERILRNELESFEQEERMGIDEATLWMERELADELTRRKMILDGVLAVQLGDSPRILAQRLDSHRSGS